MGTSLFFATPRTKNVEQRPCPTKTHAYTLYSSSFHGRLSPQMPFSDPHRDDGKRLGNLRNDDEGTTTTLHIRGRLDRGFGFRRENLKVKRTILREDDGIFCLSMAFKDLRNSLIISYDDGFIDDEEFVLLYDLYSSKDLDFPYDAYALFDLEELDEAECVAEFVFVKETYELWQTFDGFQIP